MVGDFVLDCSVVIAWSLHEGPNHYVDAVLDRFNKGSRAVVPPLWYYELGNGFVNARRRQRIPQELVRQSIEDIRQLPISFVQPDWQVPYSRLPAEIILSEDSQLTFYDASYLVLALRLQIPLASLDRELKKAALTMGIDDLIAAA